MLFLNGASNESYYDYYWYFNYFTIIFQFAYTSFIKVICCNYLLLTILNNWNLIDLFLNFNILLNFISIILDLFLLKLLVCEFLCSDIIFIFFLLFLLNLFSWNWIRHPLPSLLLSIFPLDWFLPWNIILSHIISLSHRMFGFNTKKFIWLFYRFILLFRWYLLWLGLCFLFRCRMIIKYNVTFYCLIFA